MNYAELAKTVMPDIERAVALINNPEIDPEVRRLNLEILFRTIGEDMYFVIYDMNAFDMNIWETYGPGMSDSFYGLAKNVSDSITTGGSKNVQESVRMWVKDVIAQAQRDAFDTARDFSQYPTVRREAVGKTCDWCKGLVGTHIDPSRDIFKRHAYCDCKIITSGFRTRNGELHNYVKLTPQEFSERQRDRGVLGAQARWGKTN